MSTWPVARQRIVTGLCLFLPAVGIILLGGMVLKALAILLVVAINYEYCSCFVTRRRRNAIILTAVYCALLFGYLFYGPLGIIFGLVLALLLIFSLFILYVETQSDQPDFENTLPAVLVGLCYPAAISVLMVAATDMVPNRLIFWLVLVVICTDTFAYFGGSAIGGAKLAMRTSPKKTISGTVCGLVAAILAAAAAAYFLSLPGHPALYAAYGLAAAVLAVLGDLAESLLKRAYGVKDTGTLLPGHGGLMDRLDALLFATTLLFVIV